ncbi:response regulator [Polaromonas sp. C04]|uniref:response regulator n=1 Tax=Polaromonas sp. C04 TaxID=1945857 RepID=UPI0009853880|nr:response regulator [Polaromonas sp. C04]OOG50564.1 response regulator [Polaromonas sp. C04]
MSFPLYQSPGTIVFLDDDPDYLDMLALVMPEDWHVRLFRRPQTCINYLQQEPPLWEADAWAQQEMIEESRAGGAPLISQILRYWGEHSRRYALTQVCVVDYSMPGMDGLQALSELVDWPGLRVLLTGQADEQIAVDAFNRGLIEQFIPKQTPDISRRLIDTLRRMQATASGRHSQIWRSTLTQSQNALLRVPSIAQDLSEFVASHWVEYVVIGRPFGILGRDANGRVGWLQLEPVSGLGELAELAGSAGVSSQGVAEIQKGKKLADLELGQALGRTTAPELGPALPIGREESLLGALFAVGIEHSPHASTCYHRWLAAQPKRFVQE